MPGDPEQVLAIARDLGFCGRLLVELLQGSELSREEWALADFCRSVGEQVGALAGTLARFAEQWRGPERRS